MGLELAHYHVSQGRTNDCGPYAATIAANALIGRQHYYASETGLDMRYRWPNGATPPWAMANWLRSHQFKANVVARATVPDLLRDADRVVDIVMVGCWWPLRIHWKCVEGYEPLTDMWAFVDSAYAVPIVNQSTAEFIKRWRAFGRIVIEVSK